MADVVGAFEIELLGSCLLITVYLSSKTSFFEYVVDYDVKILPWFDSIVGLDGIFKKMEAFHLMTHYVIGSNVTRLSRL